MIHHDSALTYDIVIKQVNTIKDKITIFYGCFQPNLISKKKLFKKFLDNFICVIINLGFYVITIWMRYTLSSVSLEKMKLIAIVNWVFYVSDFLKLFMSFKFGFISQGVL